LPPASVLSEAQVKVAATLTPIQVESPLIKNSPQAEVCSPLAGIDLVEILEIVSSPYDPPPPGKEDRHHGIDFAYYRRGEQLSIQGTGIQALLPGVVVMALEGSFPYGNVIIVESSLAAVPEKSMNQLEVREGESLYTLYAHLETSPQVFAGQDVAACQLLGTVGKSGNAGVAHLHLETRLGPGGSEFESMGYYLAESTQQEKENYLRWRIGGEFRHFNPLTLLAPEVLP
jgi:murein DD-endopeptidase MepM/ murein hydrolase activator NlpD